MTTLFEKFRMFRRHAGAGGAAIGLAMCLAAAGVNAKPQLWVNISADGSLVAGDSVMAKFIIATDVTDFDGAFIWTAVDLGGKNSISNGSLRVFAPGRFADDATGDKAYNNDDDSVYVYAKKAYTTIRLHGQYCDNETGVCVSDSADIYVVPGPAKHLYIEVSQDSLTSLNAPNPLDTIRIQSGAMTVENFWAILRDDYGNWVGRAAMADPPAYTTLTPLVWGQLDSIVAKVTNGMGYGQGRVTKGSSFTSDTTTAYVSTSVTGRDGVTRTLTDSLIVSINLEFVGIRIGIKVGGANGTFIPASTFTIPNLINMAIPSDTTLWVQLLLDNGQWVESETVWTATGGFNPPLTITPSIRRDYIYIADQPTAIGSDGVITVAVPGNPTIADVVRIRVAPPITLSLHIEPQNSHIVSPNTSMGIDTLMMAEGDVDRSIYAVLRDQYGNFVSYADSIVWSVDDTSVVTVSNGNMAMGGGIVTRVNPGVTTVRATSSKLNIADSVVVKVFGFDYKTIDFRIEHNGEEVGDILILDQRNNPSVVLNIVGYDVYGNKLGGIPAKWCAIGDLPGINGDSACFDDNDLRSFILYDITSATENGTGRICASVPGNPDIVEMCVPVKVIVTDVSVLTRDREIPDIVIDEWVSVVASLGSSSFEIAAGPNPVQKSDGVVRFFVGADFPGRPLIGINNITGSLTIYDVAGNVVRKIRVGDNIGNRALHATPLRDGGVRTVGVWDLRDAKDRLVPAGTYLVRGTLTSADGKRKRVSAVVGVR